jgi:signal transduction histidine kinase
VISIDADQNYFLETARFKSLFFLGAGFLTAVWAGMLVLLFVVDRKAKQASLLAARNERLAFLGHTSAQLAHELKNPLGIMKTSVDAFRKRHDPEKKEQTLSFISEEIMRLSTIIDTILNLSRDKTFSRELFSPRQALLEMLPSFNESYALVSVTVDIAENIAVRGDPAAFRQIADNLMRNAGNAMQGAGSIAISGRQQHTRFVLLFGDTGPGIDPALAKKLFEPFVSGSKTGTGLGLAIVRSLCDALGWSIDCTSREKGSTMFALGFKEGLWQKS